MAAPETDNLYGKYHSKKNLKNFAKVHLEHKETKVVEMQLTDRDFSFWDVEHKAWKVEPGQYTVLVGAASDDIRVSTKIDI